MKFLPARLWSGTVPVAVIFPIVVDGGRVLVVNPSGSLSWVDAEAVVFKRFTTDDLALGYWPSVIAWQGE